MPVRNGSMMDMLAEYVKIKAHYGGDMLISDLDSGLTFSELCEKVREMCGVRRELPITLKWIDDEGDPCTISSQMELDEAFRIYSRNKRSGLLLHVFPSIPEKPGMPCPGEDSSLLPLNVLSSSVFFRDVNMAVRTELSDEIACCSRSELQVRSRRCVKVDSVVKVTFRVLTEHSSTDRSRSLTASLELQWNLF
ncbi:hypothetical protein MHYP_G00329050 [Metynnis hypsauchen]